MYLMEGSKLIDAHVLDGCQKIAKPVVANFVFPLIFVSFHSFIQTWS